MRSSISARDGAQHCRMDRNTEISGRRQLRGRRAAVRGLAASKRKIYLPRPGAATVLDGDLSTALPVARRDWRGKIPALAAHDLPAGELRLCRLACRYSATHGTKL